jgi:hypothetical protein
VKALLTIDWNRLTLEISSCLKQTLTHTHTHKFPEYNAVNNQVFLYFSSDVVAREGVGEKLSWQEKTNSKEKQKEM